MPQPRTRRGFIVILIVMLFGVQMIATAQEAAVPGKEHTQESPDPAGPILVDALLLRPLGLAEVSRTGVVAIGRRSDIDVAK